MELVEDIKPKIQVNEGFKKTEVGVIPNDWKVVRLKDLITDKPTYGINAPAVDFSENLPQYLRITDISDSGEYIHSGKASVRSSDWKKYILKEGEIVFARTGASVGKSYLYNPKDGILVYAGFLIKITPDSNLIDSKYLAAFLQTKGYWNWVAVMSMRSGQPGINGIEYGSLFIPLPPTLKEQKAIAKALSDVDALISNLDKLITKKKAIKQGAMQQLLKSPKHGGKRLPGFEGEWEVNSLADLTTIQTGSTPPTADKSNYGSEYMFVSPADLGNSVFIAKTEKRLSKKGFYMSRAFPKNSVLFTCIGSTIGKTGIAKEALTSNQQINAVFPSDKLYYKFAYYILTYLSPQIKSLAGEQAVPQINKTQFQNTLVEVPSFEEQQAIATTLWDMDSEIENFEKKKAKYQRIKQGMMQELLTGKTRLV